MGQHRVPKILSIPNHFGVKIFLYLLSKPSMKPLIIRVQRDEKFLKALQIELELFVSELQDLVKKLR